MRFVRNMATSSCICLGMILSLAIGMASVGSAIAVFVNMRESHLVRMGGDPRRQVFFEVRIPGGHLDEFKKILKDVVNSRKATDVAIAGSIQSKDTGYFHEVTAFYSSGKMMSGVFRINSGRAITSADLANRNMVAVGGSKALKRLGVQPTPGEKIMTPIGDFTVVGVLGARIGPSHWDNVLFVPLSVVMNIGRTRDDGKNCVIGGMFMTKDYKQSIALANNDPFKDIPWIDDSSGLHPLISDTYNSTRESLIPAVVLSLAVLIIAIVNTGLLGMLWVLKRRKEYAIRMAVGADQRIIIKEILHDMASLWLVAVLPMMLIRIGVHLFVLSKWDIPLPLDLFGDGAAALVGLLTAVVSSLLPIKESLRIYPVEAFQRNL